MEALIRSCPSQRWPPMSNPLLQLGRLLKSAEGHGKATQSVEEHVLECRRARQIVEEHVVASSRVSKSEPDYWRVLVKIPGVSNSLGCPKARNRNETWVLHSVLTPPRDYGWVAWTKVDWEINVENQTLKFRLSVKRKNGEYELSCSR